MKALAFILTLLLSVAAHARQPADKGYAPVNGLKMYYEVHGSGDPIVLVHGSFMTITSNWNGWIDEFAKSRKVIAIEMQGHGRTADIDRDFAYESLADDVAALLDHLKIPSADVLGYSMGGGVALQCAIRHPEKFRKVVSISAVFRHDGWVKEALDVFPMMSADMFKGSPIETEYKKLSPTPEKFAAFIPRVLAMDQKHYDFGADKLKATKAPIFFIHGDADGVRLDHIAEMFRIKGEEIMGDMRPRSKSRLAIIPDTTHVTLIYRPSTIVPMVNDFLGASAAAQPAAPKQAVEEKQVTKPLPVHYLEIVTPSVNETCDALAKAHGVMFGEPVLELGNARTADLKGGWKIGVRAPMRTAEQPVIRPYVLVDDINAVLKAAEAAGGKIALPGMEIPGHGTCAIYVLGGIDHGLWQLAPKP
jgi:pimeloyl-ACP methyl ester carboxylesterase/predicted enzyme related to lactoylglutathione lyase